MPQHHAPDGDDGSEVTARGVTGGGDGAAAPTPLLIGAYAALPAAEDRPGFYAGLREHLGATGLEVPTQHLLAGEGGSIEDLARLLEDRFPDSVLTAIPGTMQHVAADPSFGLASPDEDGRRAALAYTAGLLSAADAVNQRIGSAHVRRVQIQSAPSGRADADAFPRSLADLEVPEGIDLVIEHCDAANDRVAGEKRFLSLREELAAAREAGIGLTLNWGRSAVESHDPSVPQEQVAEAAAAGSLRGLIFSGAGGNATGFGAPWADAHLPLDVDEPGSLLTAARVRECMAAAGDLEYVGVKVQAPSDADVSARLGIIGHVVEAIRASGTGRVGTR
ncbi:DUF4862 domain-containing protein [Brachybacterium endophyticum]|uniref:DUF4862 domain-containing protein n=1 Tax=Brachybacterium endophyticum TaxID=2182385 RepID=A0A2U2RHB6_9MICO|nr:DUF4862 family protein [Brachybacterium endophyticum]PWH05244.1 DUF4862 domain-containing protein [Brachybacterium endophyticum]